MAVNGGHAGTKKGPNWGHVTAAETAGETRGAGESAEGTAAETAGGHCPCSEKERKSALFSGSLHSSSPSTTPNTTPNTPSFPSSFRSSFGEPGLGALVDGRGNPKT